MSKTKEELQKMWEYRRANDQLKSLYINVLEYILSRLFHYVGKLDKEFREAMAAFRVKRDGLKKGE